MGRERDMADRFIMDLLMLSLSKFIMRAFLPCIVFYSIHVFL
jgi:hypothetical protein